jgi:predicted nuclease of predicted toxin-antitoxin system
MAIRFHLDEHMDHDVARGLRRRGVDVTTTADADLIGAADELHVAFAVAERRVVVTNDADFLRIAGAGTEHMGIVFCPANSRSVGYLVRFLCLVHDTMEAEEIIGQIEYA